MIERSMDGAKESAAVAFALDIVDPCARRIQPLVHPAVVARHEPAVFGCDHETRFCIDCIAPRRPARRCSLASAARPLTHHSRYIGAMTDPKKRALLKRPI